MTVDMFRTQMETYGNVRHLVLKPMAMNKWAYGVVEYEDPDNAFAAIDDLNGNVLYGRRVTVEFAHSWWNTYHMAKSTWVNQGQKGDRKATGAAASKGSNKKEFAEAALHGADASSKRGKGKKGKGGRAAAAPEASGASGAVLAAEAVAAAALAEAEGKDEDKEDSSDSSSSSSSSSDEEDGAGSDSDSSSDSEDE